MKTILEASHREFRSFWADGSGTSFVLPVVVTDRGILHEFARYMFLNRFKSRSWQDASVFATQLLIEFIHFNFKTTNSPQQLFSAFASAVFTGTIENSRDRTGLWWQARQPENANRIITALTNYFDWLECRNENTDLQLNPWRLATRHEDRLNWAARLHKLNNAFLAHLIDRKRVIGRRRAFRYLPLPQSSLTPAKAFDESRIDKLLNFGLTSRLRRADNRDLRNVLICYLMHYGGLRLSEALSLWREDVTIEKGETIVRIYHPQYGVAADGRRRDQILANQYGLKPRYTLIKATDPLFLGWKNCLITDPHKKCFEVFFYPAEKSQEFALLWRDYHLWQRVSPASGADHPYAFTNQYGQPYSHRMFRKAHKQAITKLGMTYGKLYGTTPHGHRHSYGQRLAAANIDLLTIKNAMHHASIESSKVYTQPTPSQIREKLAKADIRLGNKDNSPPDSEISYVQQV